tara:strand:- start:1139 stop:2548 length:1410 start_codon:yes stop_codon:yes gene_type:complete
VAETWRVIGKSRKRTEFIANNLVASSDSQWPVVHFFYPPASDIRLSDEDLREIYFLLCGAYPSEVAPNPDIIHLISKLSETEVTEISMDSAHNRLTSILSDVDNETRTKLLHPLFFRMNARDLKVFLLRCSSKGGPAKRRDIINALCEANGERFHHVRSAVNLMGLQRIATLFSGGLFEYEAVRPRMGWPMVIPAPHYISEVALTPFSSCYVELVEGAWVTVHVKDSAVVGFTASGNEIPEDGNTLRKWATSAGLPNGIFLCDYAEMRDNPLLVIDLLSPEDLQLTFKGRRKLLEDNIAPWALKNLTYLGEALDLVESLDEKAPVVLRNSRGILTYENTQEELVLVQHEKKKSILRVTAGKVVQPQTGAPPYMVWTVSARDGLGYYPLGELEADGREIHSFIKRHIDGDWKMIEGETIRIDVPCFVEVSITASGWGDFGPYINGTIESGSPSSGISDVIGVEEIGWATH